MAVITYLKGDATQPQAKGNRIIAHVCNDPGGWGKGFVVAVSKRWPEPEAAYRAWHRNRAENDFGLDLDSLSADEWSRVQLMFVCSPGNQIGLQNTGQKRPGKDAGIRRSGSRRTLPPLRSAAAVFSSHSRLTSTPRGGISGCLALG